MLLSFTVGLKENVKHTDHIFLKVERKSVKFIFNGNLNINLTGFRSTLVLIQITVIFLLIFYMQKLNKYW